MLAHVGRKSLGAHNCVSLFLNAVSHSVTRAGRDEIGEQMADRSRDTHARGGEAPRRRDSSRDFDRRRDDGGRSSSRWEWKSGDRRPGRDDRRGGGSRRARSRDRAADDRPTKRFRNDPTRGPQPGGRDAPHPRAPGMKPTTRRSTRSSPSPRRRLFQARRRRRRRRGARREEAGHVRLVEVRGGRPASSGDAPEADRLRVQHARVRAVCRAGSQGAAVARQK